ncbi:MAG: hypothetical protein AB7V14_06335 [Kiritimatiellia bacterium]
MKSRTNRCGKPQGIGPAIDAVRRAADEARETFRPIASLIGKSEKAQRNLAPGTWQHSMLRDNLQALRMASALMDPGAGGGDRVERRDLQDALRAFAAMIGKTAKAQAKFPPGTSHYALQRNRLKALRAAEALIQAELDPRRVQEKNPRKP